MTRDLAVPVAVFCVAVASVGCGSSSSVTTPGPAAAAPPAAWSQSASSFATALTPRGVSKTAAIDDFRVHPDPGDDGIVRVFEGQPVIVNAADIASAPPAPQVYLIVNWGDDGNERVGCGPCRLEHLYALGRYTLVATADDLHPEGQAGRVKPFDHRHDRGHAGATRAGSRLAVRQLRLPAERACRR